MVLKYVHGPTINRNDESINEIVLVILYIWWYGEVFNHIEIQGNITCTKCIDLVLMRLGGSATRGFTSPTGLLQYLS